MCFLSNAIHDVIVCDIGTVHTVRLNRRKTYPHRLKYKMVATQTVVMSVVIGIYVVPVAAVLVYQAGQWIVRQCKLQWKEREPLLPTATATATATATSTTATHQRHEIGHSSGRSSRSNSSSDASDFASSLLDRDEQFMNPALAPRVNPRQWQPINDIYGGGDDAEDVTSPNYHTSRSASDDVRRSYVEWQLPTASGRSDVFHSVTSTMSESIGDVFLDRQRMLYGFGEPTGSPMID